VSDDVKKSAYRGLFVINFMISLGFGIVDPFFSVYAVSAGATAFHIALIFSAYAVAKMLMSPLIGWWSDHRGRHELIIAGLCICLAVSLCYLLTPGPLALIALRIIQGIGAALVRPIALAFIGDMAPARREARAMGTFDISYYSAQAVGPIIGGGIKDFAGFPGVFLSLALLCFLSLLSSMFFMMISPADRPDTTARSRPHPGGPRISRIIVGLSGFIFTRSFSIVLFTIFIPIFMYDRLKLTGLEMGIVMGAGTVVTALLLRPMGSLSDKLNRRWLVVCGGSMTALLTFCLPLAQSFGHLLSLSVAIGIFRVVSLPASSALLVREGNIYGMGLAMGVFNGALNCGTVLAPLAGGFALGFFGIETVFQGAAILGLLGIVFFCLCSWPAANRKERGGSVCLRVFQRHSPIAGKAGAIESSGGMKMVGKRRVFAKMSGLLLSLLFLGVLTAPVLFSADAFTADKHIKTGLNCDSCHEAVKAAAGATVGMAKCLSCHGPYEKLAKRTDNLILNWHDNPHYGELDCNECHHGHKADDNSCRKCHKK
jgi:MFS transporter, DHA1 family, multidrug resistance protein